MATIQTGWSASTSNFDGILSNSEAKKYYALPISTINTVLNNAGIPTNAQITDIKLTATMSVECSSMGGFYAQIGYGTTSSINSTLLGETCICDWALSGSITKTVGLNAVLSNGGKSPFALSTGNGGYITFYIYSSVRGKKTYVVKNVYLDVTYAIPTYTITVQSNNTNYGIVSGGGSYDNQATATLTATPNTGYKFVQWSDGNTSATRTVTVTGNATYTATFEKLRYTVTWKNGDTVLETDTNVEYGTTPTYNGSTPTKAPTAQYTYTFSGWSPAVGGITGDTTYTAQFASTERKYTISTSVAPSGSGTVSGGGSYGYNGSATLTATANTDYIFKRWSDGVTTATRTVTVTSNVTYTAEFIMSKIYIGTSQAKEIYVGTIPVKEIYIGTTKVYG